MARDISKKFIHSASQVEVDLSIHAKQQIKHQTKQPPLNLHRFGSYGVFRSYPTKSVEEVDDKSILEIRLRK